MFTDEAAEERLALSASERNALLHAVEKLEAFGPQLGYPHSSAVQGFAGLRELRPRAGRSPWRRVTVAVRNYRCRTPLNHTCNAVSCEGRGYTPGPDNDTPRRHQ